MFNHHSSPSRQSRAAPRVCLRQNKASCNAVCISAVIFAFIFARGAIAADPPFELPSRRELSKLRTAVVSTGKGDLRFELFPEAAPWHVANFKYLADKGFYRNLTFTLYFPGYIIQGGEPRNGESGPGYSLPPEFNEHKHTFGSLGMARRKDYINPERRSNGCQFHILLSKAQHMDGSYTLFGQLIEGEEVLEKLRQGDRIKDVKVYVREE